MAVELITGYAGTAHVGSDDARSAIAGIVGTGSYYSSHKTPVVSMTNANTLHITECWLYLGGGFFHVEDADATIGNGEGVLKRCDLLCVEYDKDASSSIESAKLVVVKGTAGSTATVPTVTSGDLIAGCSVAQFPIAKVTLDGLTPTAALMVGKAPTTAALQDSVSQSASGDVGWPPVHWHKRNGVCTVSIGGILSFTIAATAEASLGTLPEGCRPDSMLVSRCEVVWGSGITLDLRVYPTGEITMCAPDAAVNFTGKFVYGSLTFAC